MSVKMRLQRFGTHNRPFYHVVVADSRCARDGKFLEHIGTYNPLTEPSTIELKVDRMVDWYKKGARPSDTVNILLRNKKIDLAQLAKAKA